MMPAEHWTEISLAEMIAFVIGGDWGTESPSDSAKKKIRVIRGTELSSQAFENAAVRYIKETSFDKRRLLPGNIIIEISGGGPTQPVGRCLLVTKALLTLIKDPIICSNFFRKIELSSHVASSYVNAYLLLAWFQGKMDNYQNHSTNIRNLDFPTFSQELMIPLPPLAEQERIVEKLGAILPRVKAVKQRLDKIPKILKRFRQSVLAAACSGKLTEDWREKNPDVENANILFEKITISKQKEFERLCEQSARAGKRKPKSSVNNKLSKNVVGDLPEIPESWGFFRLDDLSHLVTDGTHRTPKYLKEGMPFLSVKNVRSFLIRDDDIKYISKEEYKEINSRCNPEKNDILYTKIGATFGYAALNDREYPFSIFVSLALIKPVNPFFDCKYAEIVMNSEIIFVQARERVTGIGTPDLHLIEIRDFRTPLPPLEEQHEIVRRVEAMFKLADSLEAKYSKAMQRIEKIEQAVLAKAFRGELAEQNPNDEPAEELLKRILAEKERLTAAGKKKPAQKRTVPGRKRIRKPG